MISFLTRPPVQDNVETAGRCNYELLKLLVRVSASWLPTWNVVEVVDSFDLKRYVAILFNERQIASHIFNFRKFNYATYFFLRWNEGLKE